MNEQIKEDLKNAMKSQDKFTLSVLRMLKSALQLEEINKKHELDDNEVISVVKKQVKVRKDSINEFVKYGKNDTVEKLQNEIDILSKYLPEEMTEEDIKKVIDEVFVELKPTGMKDMGGVMKELTPRLSNADISLVSKMVKEKLN